MRVAGSRFGALVGALVMTMLSLAWWAVPASAHDELVGSNPSDGATVTALPRVVHLYFEEPPVSGYTAAAVLGPTGRSLNSGALVSAGASISIPIHASKTRGTYRVRYHVLSDDGHVVSGVVRFRLGAVAGASARQLTTQSPASSSSSAASLGPIAAVAGVVVVGAGAGVAYGRRGSARRRAALLRR
jgi:copper resistance protein C